MSFALARLRSAALPAASSVCAGLLAVALAGHAAAQPAAGQAASQPRQAVAAQGAVSSPSAPTSRPVPAPAPSAAQARATPVAAAASAPRPPPALRPAAPASAAVPAAVLPAASRPAALPPAAPPAVAVPPAAPSAAAVPSRAVPPGASAGTMPKAPAVLPAAPPAVSSGPGAAAQPAALVRAPAPPGSAAPVGQAAPGAKAPRPPGPYPIFVLNSLDASISVIDPVGLVERRRIPTGKEPHHLYLTPDEKSLIVANALGDTLTFVDPATGEVQRTLAGIGDPYHLRFSPDMKWFVTAANRLDFIAIYRWQPGDAAEPFRLVKRLEASRTPSHLSIDSRSTVVYATLQDSDELIAIDLASQAPRWKIPVGRMPADVYLTADDRLLFVGLTGADHVEVYDVSRAAPALVARIRTGMGAHAFRARGDRRHLYVSNRVANTISLLDTQTLAVVESYPAPGGPDCIDVTADGRRLLVTSRWARKLTVIDLEKKEVARQVPVGRSPHGVWTLDHAPRL